jgi:hypothetical protein
MAGMVMVKYEQKALAELALETLKFAKKLT